jgi:hypothetical protein
MTWYSDILRRPGGSCTWMNAMSWSLQWHGIRISWDGRVVHVPGWTPCFLGAYMTWCVRDMVSGYPEKAGWRVGWSMYLYERHVLTLPKGGSATRKMFVVVVLRRFFSFVFLVMSCVAWSSFCTCADIYLCCFTNSCALTFFSSFLFPFLGGEAFVSISRWMVRWYRESWRQDSDILQASK